MDEDKGDVPFQGQSRRADFELPYNSKDYSLEDLRQLASEGKTIRCVIADGIRLTLYYIGPGPGNVDVAKFIGPCIPDASGGSAYSATMNSNKDWSGGTTHSQYSWSDLIGNQPAPIAHSHSADDVTSGTFDAARIPNISASKITSGTLPVGRGGTGKTTTKEAFLNLASGLVNGTKPEDGEQMFVANGDFSNGWYYTLQEFFDNYIKGKLTGTGVDIGGSSNKLQIKDKLVFTGATTDKHAEQFNLNVSSDTAGGVGPAYIAAYRFEDKSSNFNKTKSPFTDGFVISIPWTRNYGMQIAFEDESSVIRVRHLHDTDGWSEWSGGDAGNATRPVFIEDGQFKTCNFVVI